MPRRKFSFLFVIIALFLTGCVTTGPNLTPLEIGSLQTRSFEASETEVFKAVISVFQDLGYIITNADKDTGFITAESATQTNNTFSKVLLGMNLTSQTKATGFVQKTGRGVQLRINFVETNASSGSFGQSDRSDTPILNAEIYNRAFEMVSSRLWYLKSSRVLPRAKKITRAG